MPNTGHFDSQAVFPTTTRKARSSDVPIEDRFVGYSYIEATFGHGFGRTSIWRRVREGNFPKPTLIGNQNKWRKSTIDAVRDALIPPTSESST